MELRDELWNDDAVAGLYGGDTAAYQAAVLEQYKVYLEMADRISQRRGSPTRSSSRSILR